MKIRQALNMAVNKQAIVDQYYGVYADLRRERNGVELSGGSPILAVTRFSPASDSA